MLCIRSKVLSVVAGTGLRLSSRSQSVLSGAHSQKKKDVKALQDDLIINPVDLSEENVCERYCVSSEEMKASFPSSLPRTFSSQTAALRETCWILRRQSYDIINELRNFDHTHHNKFRYLLYGADGTGKTICLHQILHYCVKAGFLIIFVPGVFSWTHSDMELRPSPRAPGLFDQPEAATNWLKSFRSLNSSFITQMQLSRDRQWGKKDHSVAGEELNKVIELGLFKPLLATEVVIGVLQELVTVSDKFKMVLAVDEFNGCFTPTSLRTQQKEWVTTQQLNLVQSFLHHIPQFPGPLLLSLSRSRMLRCSATGWTPNDLLIEGAVSKEMREKAQEVLEICRSIEIPVFTREEMMKYLNFLSERKWMNTELTPTVLNELWYLSEGNPIILQNIIASL